VTLLLKMAKACWPRCLAVSSAEADITHIDMDDETAAETTELRLAVSVRDRLHLADVMRTLRAHPRS